MNRVIFLRINRPSFIDGLSDYIYDSAQGFGTNGDHDGVSGVSDTLSSHQSISLIQGDCSDTGVSQMLSDFQNQTVVNTFYL